MTCRAIKIALSAGGTGEPGDSFEREGEAVRFARSLETGLRVFCG